jgi:hypothetical protein
MPIWVFLTREFNAFRRKNAQQAGTCVGDSLGLDGLGRPSLSAQKGRTGVSALHLLDVQVLHIQRVVFYEFSAGFYVFAHQGGEDSFALGDVFELY